MENQELFDLLYPLGVTAVLLFIYFIFYIKINRAEKQKLVSIKKRKIQDAVETDSPVSNQNSSLKKRGISGLEVRFAFIRRILPLTLLFLWIVLVSLPYLGSIPSVYVSIIAAIFSVVAGFALRPFLENLFSGIIISFFKAIRIGDTVIIDGQYGLVEEIGLTYSLLKRWDWGRIVIPNSKLLQKEVENLTINDPFIWAHIEFFVAPQSNLSQVEALAKQVAKGSKFFNNVEEPSFWVMELQKDSIKCWLAAWAANPSDAWELRNEMRTDLLKELQKAGVDFHKYNINQ